MASKEHVQLSSYIKSTHENLRTSSKILGFDTAWKLHCENKNLLQNYACAMEKLATKYWDNNAKNTDGLVKSRIEWIYDFCMAYFMNGGILDQRIKEYNIATKINLKLDLEDLTTEEVKLKLLDVGSCYNAFAIYDCFEVFPLDIAPATKEVFQCDFLKLNIVDDRKNYLELDGTITHLERSSFHIVVFSLLLEYLPSPIHRLLCCLNAYKLLKPEGLLIIITPDSNHVGVNAKIMKSWRYHLAKLGFSRIKYEKLPYLHCMAFRKSLKSEIASRWADIQKHQNFFDSFVIPQDFNKSTTQTAQNVENDPEMCISLFKELPTF